MLLGRSSQSFERGAVLQAVEFEIRSSRNIGQRRFHERAQALVDCEQIESRRLPARRGFEARV